MECTHYTTYTLWFMHTYFIKLVPQNSNLKKQTHIHNLNYIHQNITHVNILLFYAYYSGDVELMKQKRIEIPIEQQNKILLYKKRQYIL